MLPYIFIFLNVYLFVSFYHWTRLNFNFYNSTKESYLQIVNVFDITKNILDDYLIESYLIFNYRNNPFKCKFKKIVLFYVYLTYVCT